MDLICKSCCLNNTTRIYIIFFHSHVFSQYLNNVIKITLPNGPYGFESTKKKKKLRLQFIPFFWLYASEQKLTETKLFIDFTKLLECI